MYLPYENVRMGNEGEEGGGQEEDDREERERERESEEEIEKGTIRTIVMRATIVSSNIAVPFNFHLLNKVLIY